MAITHFIDSCAPEIARARIRSLTNRIPESFPVLVYGDTRPHNFIFYNSQTGLVESYSGNASYSLRVTLGQVQSGPTDGTYSVTCGSTGTVPALADAETLQDALNLLTTIISDGGVVVSGTFPNFIVTWNTLGVKTAFTADASLLVPISGISLVTMQTGSASVINQVAVVIRQAAISSQATWSTITSPNNGWTGTITTNTAGALQLLTSQGEQVGEVMEVNTLLTAEVLDASNIPVSYYQTPVVLRAKNLDPNGTVSPGTPTYALGDILYGNAQGGLSKLAGNTSGTLKVLTQTGTGVISAVPVWQAETSLGVTSVALAMPSDLFTVSGSPVTSTGTLTATVKTQVANTVWAGPTTGVDASPAFRSLVSADIPAINLAASGNGGVTGNLPVTNLNSGTSAGASTFWRGDGTWGTPTGTGVTAVSIVSANGFAGSSGGGTTPALTLSTTITGILKGNGTAISAASSGTDYAPATSGAFVLTGNSAGGFTNTDLTYSTPTLSVPDAFNVSGSGSISLTAGGSAKNVTMAPGSTGSVVQTLGDGSSTLTYQGGYTLTTSAASVGNVFLYGNSANNNSIKVSRTGGSASYISLLAQTSQPVIDCLGTLKFQQNGSDIGVTLSTAGVLTTTGFVSTSAVPSFTYAGGAAVFGNTANNNSITISRITTNASSLKLLAESNNPRIDYIGNLLFSTNSGGTIITFSTAGLITATGGYVASGTTTTKYGATAAATIGVSADTTAGILQFVTPTSGTATLTTANALSLTFSGGATATITGGAGNMTIVAGTGNSRTLTLQTTTSGGTATNALTLDATQNATIGGDLTISGGDLTLTGASTITGGAGNMTVTAGTGNSRTLILRTTTSGGTATAALTLDATQGGTFGGSITTSAPNGGTAAAWKLGTVVTGITATMVTTSYIQLDVAGTLYKLATVTSVP